MGSRCQDEGEKPASPVRSKTDATHQGRQLALRPRDLQELINTNHAAQQDTDWQTAYALRAGVEGTIRQATAVTGNRRARYRGLAKTHLEHVYSVVALNLIRPDAHTAAASRGLHWLDARPRDPEEADAFEAREYFEKRLDDLNARHCVLMHGSVLDEAEAAAEQAKHQAFVAAAQATLPLIPRTTAAETQADHDAFEAHITAAETRIDQALGEQRQHARDALHRHFPHAAESTGMHQVRIQLMDRAGLGLDAVNRAYQAIGDTSRDLDDLKSRQASGRVEFGRPRVTADQVAEATRRHTHARQRFDDLRVSRPQTLAALNALDRARVLDPSGSEGIAARAARIAAQSRERALQSHTRPGPGAPETTTHQPQQHNGQIQQTAPRPGMR
ncbi:transposase [Streptomyces sp. NBC_00435]|uniref:transposase n=1 Tax=Streptomyces sp. NBC_00435 TaxID=2903649 RepID=UPI003FA6B2DB